MDAAVETPTTTTSSAPSGDSGSSSSSTESSSSVSTPTTDRPSIKDALSVFNEAAKQQGRRTRGQQQPPAAQAETPAEGTETTATPAAATSKGPIPFEVHSTALNNARTKTRAEVEQQYAPLRQWADRARQNPAAFTVNLLREGLTNPAIAPQLYDAINQITGGQQQQPQRGPAPASLPSPDFQDANGNKFFSADTLLNQLVPYLKESLRSEILGEVQPGLQTVEQLQAERQAERESLQLKSQMQSHITTARTWPHFAQHEAEIKQALLAAPLTSGHPAEEALLLHSVYQQIVGPKLSQLEREAYNKELRDKANASTSNPSAPGSSGAVPKNARAKDGGTMAEALKWAAQQRAAR